MERNDLYIKLFKKYGDMQLIVAIEELSELQKEITKHLRDLNSNVLEEVADVYIILEQLELYFGLTKKDIEAQVKEKIKRTKKLVEGE